MQITAAKLAEMINATVEGDPNVLISSPAKIEEAGPGSITFLGNLAYEHHLYDTGATAVLVTRDFQPKQPVTPTLLRVDDVYSTVSQLLSVYQQSEAEKTTRAVSAHASVDDTAQLAQDVRIGKFSIVAEGAQIGTGSIILDQVYIGPNVKVGANCLIYPGVRIMRDCVIGDDCVLHSNVVIGGDGFGFAPDPETGRYNKVPQIGNVVIGDRVEIGAGTTIDRATMGATVIKDGVKLDNLIQIAHNVEIGENTVIAALAGIAGSAKVGANCRIGGQVGIAGHCTIANGTQIQAQAGVTNTIREKGATLGGSPHMNFRDFMRSSAVFRRLPQVIDDLRNRLKRLEEEKVL